jgi:hypothetical protein
MFRIRRKCSGTHADSQNVQISTKSAMHSKTKPATYSELKPAGVPI